MEIDPLTARLVPRRLCTDANAHLVDILGLIRNECRSFMTRDQSRISRAAQQTWWQGLDHSVCRVFLYELDSSYVGYGFARPEGQRILISGGLLKRCRGRRLGQQLFGHLASLYPETWLEVLEANTNARRLYERLGYATVTSGAVILMVKRIT